MINYLHSRFFNPHAGWDPVPLEWAKQYAEKQYSYAAETQTLTTELESLVGSFCGKRILDLGGGPGQFSASFAEKGGHVTWHDVSANYRSLASDHATARKVIIDFSLGYLEEAKKFLSCPFDLVFSRLAWCYSMNDFKFAELIYSLVAPGGFGCIILNIDDFEPKCSRTLTRNLVYKINRLIGIKIGHPHPPRGRTEKVIARFKPAMLNVQYPSAETAKIIFQRARAK